MEVLDLCHSMTNHWHRMAPFKTHKTLYKPYFKSFALYFYKPIILPPPKVFSRQFFFNKIVFYFAFGPTYSDSSSDSAGTNNGSSPNPRSSDSASVSSVFATSASKFNDFDTVNSTPNFISSRIFLCGCPGKTLWLVINSNYFILFYLGGGISTNLASTPVLVSVPVLLYFWELLIKVYRFFEPRLYISRWQAHIWIIFLFIFHKISLKVNFSHIKIFLGAFNENTFFDWALDFTSPPSKKFF